MMTASRETTPLLGRRRAPSSLASPSDDLIDEDESSFQTSPSLNSRDTSKTDRRPWYARLAASCQAGLRGTARPSSSFSASPAPSRRRNPHFYMDDYNDFSWHCAFGTRETDGIWLNAGDKAGVWMSLMVWLLIVYSGVTVTLLCQQHRVHVIVGIVYTTICGLALASHAKTTFTDPGSIPHSAVPSYTAKALTERHILCGQCQGYKPHTAHHCRVCNRCIARMDHHCPWMNNCIGAANLKHFVLFLAYTWIGCALALLLFCHNYFACQNEDCMFSVVLVQLVRAMTAICVMALLFTSSMLMSVTYSVMTGSTTIDRYKKKLQNDATLSDEEPMALVDIFGIAPYWTWVLPIDPVFGDHDKVMGYCTPQRLLREHMIMQPGDPNDDGEGMTSSGAGSTSIGESDSRGYADV